MIALRCVDRNWTTHIDSMAKLKEGIGLRGYARTDPLKDYVDEGWNMFNEMITKISNEVVLNLLKIEVRMKTPEEMEQERLAREQASKNEQPKGE